MFKCRTLGDVNGRHTFHGRRTLSCKQEGGSWECSGHCRLNGGFIHGHLVKSTLPTPLQQHSLGKNRYLNKGEWVCVFPELT